jgi:hypothetical protein
MKKSFAVIFLVLICSCAPSGRAGDDGTAFTFIDEFEGGKLYKAGAVYVVEMHSNYRQMGVSMEGF